MPSSVSISQKERGQNGDNNVASMLLKNFKRCVFLEKSKEEGAGLGEYMIVMDNCNRQHKNRIVI